MKPPCVLLVDGPVSIYLYDATEEEIVAALNRLRPALTVAAKQIGASQCSATVTDLPTRESSSSEKPGETTKNDSTNPS